MKVLAVNGSPRKQWNTATLLEKALEGAAAEGAETRLVHLYDLQFKGCISCFACKRKGGKSYGQCVVRDDLAPVYAEIEQLDALILGSPIYFGNTTGEMRSFLERLLFPYFVYDSPPRSLFMRTLASAWIYTMNVTEEVARQMGYEQIFDRNEHYLRLIFGDCQSLMSYDTLQFQDYAKMAGTGIDVEAKQRRHETVFPEDCQRAFALGSALVKPA